MRIFQVGLLSLLLLLVWSSPAVSQDPTPSAPAPAQLPTRPRRHQVQRLYLLRRHRRSMT